jgi:hypothetical protein
MWPFRRKREPDLSTRIEGSYNNRMETKKNIASLSSALKDHKDMSSRDSEDSIFNNIVTVAMLKDAPAKKEGGLDSYKTKSLGSGLMITEDGFVITAYHNIEAYEDEWRMLNREKPRTMENFPEWIHMLRKKYIIINHEKTDYAIDIRFWAANRAYDIALIKAITFKQPRPIRFRMDISNLKKGDDIKLFSLRDQKSYNQLGKVITPSYEARIPSADGEDIVCTYDNFLTDAYGVPGFSGGAFLRYDGRFCGLATHTTGEGKEVEHTGGTKARNILRLVMAAEEGLKSSLIKK